MESTKVLNRQNILKMVFESALIIFSVLLALFLNEYRGQLKENQAKKQALQMVKIELKANLETINEWYPYHGDPWKGARKPCLAKRRVRPAYQLGERRLHLRRSDRWPHI